MSYQVVLNGKPIAYRATLTFIDGEGKYEDIWECEHAHNEYGDALQCAKIQVDHMVEMAKP